MKSRVTSYEDLQVWQKAMLLVTDVYRLTEAFPKKEQYRLTDQLCRAAISVPSNIAEGSARRSTKDYIRFVNIAYSSLMECETQIRIAEQLGYIDEVTKTRMIIQTQEIGKMSNALYTALKLKLDTPKSSSTEYRILNTEY